jgi:DNA-binding MarR family transcriptional regulator
MTNRVTKIVAATAAATALVAGGYAIGTRGDGSAAAAGPNARSARGHHGWHQRGAGRAALTELATKLGVSEPKLLQALKDLRPQRREDRRGDHVSELAKALGISEAKVQAALENVHAQRPRGKDRRDARPRGMGRRGAWRAQRQARIAKLAKALGVSQTDLRVAMAKSFAPRMQDRKQRRDDFATALATKLGLDPAKVTSALEQFAAQRRDTWGARRGAMGRHRHP